MVILACVDAMRGDSHSFVVEESLFVLYGFQLRLDFLAIEARKSLFSIYGFPLRLDFLVIAMLAFIKKR